MDFEGCRHPQMFLKCSHSFLGLGSAYLIFISFIYTSHIKVEGVKPRPQASSSIRPLRACLLSASFSRWPTASLCQEKGNRTADRAAPAKRAEELTGDEARRCTSVIRSILYVSSTSAYS